MDKNTARAKTSTGVLSGLEDRLSKMPAATAEQLNIAKILSKPGNDVELKNFVSQLQELTQCTEDQAVTALYDCENNLQGAVELLLDKFRAGVDEGWHTTGRRARVKHTSFNNSDVAHNNAVGENEKMKQGITGNVEIDHTDEDVTLVVPGRKERRSFKSFQKNPQAVITQDLKSDNKLHIDNQRDAEETNRGRKSKSKSFTADGWDPYTEYGEWGGETIEIVNSNATHAEGLQDVLPDELFIETDDKIPPSDPSCDCMAPSTDVSLKSVNQGDGDSIFIKKAVSKQPPCAFNNLPDIPVFMVPNLLPQRLPQWRFKFGGVDGLCEVSPPSDEPINQEPSTQTTQDILSNTSKAHSETEAGAFSMTPTPRNQSVNRDSSLASASKVTIENVPSVTKPDVVSSSFPTSQFHSAPIPQKPSNTYANTQLGQPGSAFNSDRVTAQAGFLESSLKNYIFDNLSNDMSKLTAVDSSQVTTNSPFIHPPVQTSQIGSNFHHNQISGVSTSQQANKAQLTHMTAHGPVHTSQQPLVSNSHQQPASLPPGMPHFISQFSPAAYHMINLAGGTNNQPTLLDLEQLQMFQQQQQRILYDMQLQQQAATTSQGLLTSNSETASSKSLSHNLSSSLSHATTANAGIRPDILASAMGHAPQMISPGNPYFPYASFVLMNGFTSPFLHQQQSGADNNQNTSSGHGVPSITQHQSQPTNSQTYNNLKQSNTAVSGYEELFDLKYGDPTKQVGFKTNPQYPNSFGSFQGQGASVDGVGAKISGTHSTGGVLAPSFGLNATPGGNAGHQPFSPQFYPSPATASPYFTAAAVAVAAAAAASAQQQHQQSTTGNVGSVSANQSNPGVSSGMNSVGGTQAGGNSNAAMHLAGNSNPGLLMGPSGSLHHSHHSQRPVMSHQH